MGSRRKGTLDLSSPQGKNWQEPQSAGEPSLESRSCPRAFHRWADGCVHHYQVAGVRYCATGLGWEASQHDCGSSAQQGHQSHALQDQLQLRQYQQLGKLTTAIILCNRLRKEPPGLLFIFIW